MKARMEAIGVCDCETLESLFFHKIVLQVLKLNRYGGIGSTTRAMLRLRRTDSGDQNIHTQVYPMLLNTVIVP